MTQEDVAMNMTLAVLTVSANVMVAIALYHMKSAKRTTVVFLSQLAISNVIQGFVFLSRALFFIWHTQTSQGCLVSILVTVATTGHYVTCIFYVYLDLFLSLKKMSVNKPVISTRMSIALSILSAVAWLGFSAIGYALRNPNWILNPLAGCAFGTGQHQPSYVIFIVATFVVLFLFILACHVMTLRMMKKAYRQMLQAQSGCARTDPAASDQAVGPVETVSGSLASQPSETRNTTTTVRAGRKLVPARENKWLKKNESVIRMMFIILILFMVCWYPLILLVLVLNVCRPCFAMVPSGVLYLTRALVITQYVSNGVIYLVKIKEFKDACRRLCCSCMPKYRVVPEYPENSSTVTDRVRAAQTGN